MIKSPPFSSFSAYSATWPEPLADEAFYGLAGDIVRTIEPHTEADPAALAKALEVTLWSKVPGEKENEG